MYTLKKQKLKKYIKSSKGVRDSTINDSTERPKIRCLRRKGYRKN